MTQIAGDGYFLPVPVDRDRVVLAPGNRADVLIHPGAAGRYGLITDPYDRGNPGMMGGMGSTGSTAASQPVTLAALAVSGPSGTTTPTPRTLPAPVLPTSPPTTHRAVTFGMQMGMGGSGMGFTIDGRVFDPQRTDQTVRLGATEEWLVSNTTPMDHPFHLHVWPFHVLATSQDPAPQTTLRDVVLVPAHGWARLRVRFADFPGRSVYHCHILDHEDAGMMATIQVSP